MRDVVVSIDEVVLETGAGPALDGERFAQAVAAALRSQLEQPAPLHPDPADPAGMLASSLAARIRRAVSGEGG